MRKGWISASRLVIESSFEGDGNGVLCSSLTEQSSPFQYLSRFSGLSRRAERSSDVEEVVAALVSHLADDGQCGHLLLAEHHCSVPLVRSDRGDLVGQAVGVRRQLLRYRRRVLLVVGLLGGEPLADAWIRA